MADLAPLARPTAALLRSLWLHARVNLLLCVVIAGFLTLVFHESFGVNLVFSLCIGASIQTLIELGRFGVARHLIRRGVDTPELRSGWPGWRWMAPWVLFSAVAGHQLGMRLGGLLLGLNVPTFGAQNLRAVLIVLMITLAVSMAFTYHFFSQGRLAQAQNDAQAAARLASEHELRLLQSQLEPHMLFNTLANLRVLIGIDPPRAQAMLDRIIGYLRATLNASRTSHHPLAAEFERLQDYLALMAIRMGPRLQVALDLPEALRQVPVPPLLLQPLVENSIKHGLEPQVAGGRLAVAARREGDRLLLTVRDTGVGLPPAHHGPPHGPTPPAARGDGGGFGTAQVRERLRALFGDQAQFSLAPADDAEGGTLATLNLPWAEAGPDGRPAWAQPAQDPGAAPSGPRPLPLSRQLGEQLARRPPP